MTGILLICSSYRPDVGGVETHLQDLVSFLKWRKHQVNVLTFQPYQSSATRVRKVEREERMTILRLPRPWRSIVFAGNRWDPVGQSVYLPILLLSGTLLVSLHRKEMEVIHVHGILSTPIACLISRLFKKRCVMSLHHTYAPIRKAHKTVARVILNLPDKVLCLSNRSRSELLRIGLEGEKVQTFTYWVDLKAFQPLDKEYCKKLLGFEDKFMILFVGRLIEEKGVRILLNVAKELTKTFGDMLFEFVGLGPLAQEVTDASKHVKNLSFQGVVKNEGLKVWYSAADVVVVPSLAEEEGFPRVIVESLACGTPVIASESGSIPEALDSSVGILIEPTAESLANAITRLYTNRDELMKLACNCRVFAQKRFSENNAEEIVNAYVR